MKISILKKSLQTFLIIVLLGATICSAQDHFFTHFHSNASYYNPALVGNSGALSINAKYKSQWNAQNIEAFRTRYLSIEESIPCSIFDYGLFFLDDQEGPGRFRTYDFGFKFAGSVPWQVGEALNNFKFGGSLQWAYKSIDYNSFIFSDQLDSKYGEVDVNGIPIPTAFVFPDNNRSLSYFNPSIGISHRIIFNTSKNTSPSIFSGISMHHSYPFGKNNFGSVESILQNNARIPKRFTAFIQAEFIPKYTSRYYISVRPQIMYQKQSALSYWEVGSRFSFSRTFSVGAYYHFNKKPEAGKNTSWFSFVAEAGQLILGQQRIDLGLSYSTNFTSLINYVGPITEISISYHFRFSPSCKLAGQSQGGDPADCYFFITENKAKIYENTWYKPKDKIK